MIIIDRKRTHKVRAPDGFKANDRRDRPRRVIIVRSAHYVYLIPVIEFDGEYHCENAIDAKNTEPSVAANAAFSITRVVFDT